VGFGRGLDMAKDRTLEELRADLSSLEPGSRLGVTSGEFALLRSQVWVNDPPVSARSRAEQRLMDWHYSDLFTSEAQAVLDAAVEFIETGIGLIKRHGCCLDSFWSGLHRVKLHSAVRAYERSLKAEPEQPNVTGQAECPDDGAGDPDMFLPTYNDCATCGAPAQRDRFRDLVPRPDATRRSEYECLRIRCSSIRSCICVTQKAGETEDDVTERWNKINKSPAEAGRSAEPSPWGPKQALEQLHKRIRITKVRDALAEAVDNIPIQIWRIISEQLHESYRHNFARDIEDVELKLSTYRRTKGGV